MYLYTEETQGSYIPMITFSVLCSALCIAILILVKEFRLTNREKFKLSALAVLLSPLLGSPLAFVGFLFLEKRAAKKAIAANREWAAEKAAFLTKYRESSLTLEEKRSEKKFQEVRMREFQAAKPGAVLHRAPKNARDFEIICANWMQLWGEVDASATQFSGDEGLDVVSSNFGAQVKFYADKPVGRPEVQALYGAASGRGLQPAFFAYSSGYTSEALQWAKMVGIACFTFEPHGDAFQFAANTKEAAELALREEGWTFSDWQERSELEETLELFQQEPESYEFPAWLRNVEII